MADNIENKDFHDRMFKYSEIVDRFNKLNKGLTLGQLDKRGVFSSQEPAKGIAGCVIEQSVLDMKQNSLQEADLLIVYDNGSEIETELKVTGVEPSNKQGLKYEAKEPMSITAVSIGRIENETFLTSHFYNKIAHLLFVFYVYDRLPGQKVVPYSEYERFSVLGYKFHDIANDEIELKRFENDWLLTQKYLIEAKKTENPEELYPLLHSSIKENLFYIDIAPRYKVSPRQTPRFRFKKSYINSIFQSFYAKKKQKLEVLPNEFVSIEELEKYLHSLTEEYKGKTISELAEYFGIKINESSSNEIKQISEEIVVRMFGGKSKKISNIASFNKIGIIAKTIVLNKNGGRTEDMKLFTINLDEIMNKDLPYEETEYYDYFNEHQLLCIVFEEPSTEASLKENKFLGFKRFFFNDELLNGDIKTTYEIVKDKISNKKLIEKYNLNKQGEKIINKNTNTIQTYLNLPKSKDYNVFVRGTSSDSTNKPWVLEGKAADGTKYIHAYSQQFWIKGSYIANELKKIDFI